MQGNDDEDIGAIKRKIKRSHDDLDRLIRQAERALHTANQETPATQPSTSLRRTHSEPAAISNMSSVGYAMPAMRRSATQTAAEACMIQINLQLRQSAFSFGDNRIQAALDTFQSIQNHERHSSGDSGRQWIPAQIVSNHRHTAPSPPIASSSATTMTPHPEPVAEISPQREEPVVMAQQLSRLFDTIKSAKLK
jgi:hypothetical protein